MASDLLAATVAGLVAKEASHGIRAAERGIGRALTPNPARQAARRARRQQRQQTRAKKGKQTMGTSTRVRAPASVATIAHTKSAQIGGATDSLPIRHKEYIYDVESSQAFNTFSFPLQPGDTTTFPWLSRMASMFERYHIKNLEFGYEPNCASDTQGSVCLAPDYDAEDSAPTTFIQMSSMVGAVHGQAWTALACRCNASRLHGSFSKLYTRTGSVSGTDLKTYDAGLLHLGVSQFTGDGAHVGRLYVAYDATLHTPQGCQDAILDLLHETDSTSCPTLSATKLVDDMTGDVADTCYGTLLFNKDTFNEWPGSGEYWVMGYVIGTGLTGPWSWTNCSGTINTATSHFDAAATHAIVVASFAVTAGDVFRPAMTGATTVTNVEWFITQGRTIDLEHK